jgi:hypothetical protein
MSFCDFRFAAILPEQGAGSGTIRPRLNQSSPEKPGE